jgi:hypothetical protein
VKGRLGAFLILVLGLFMMSSTTFAHHGSQGYDHSKRVTMKATVKEFLWANPHSELFIDVKDDKGAVATWVLELNSPGNLIHIDSGWYKNVLKPGDQIAATFDAGKEGRLIGICADVLLASGQKLHSNQGCAGPPTAEQ